MSSDTAKLPLQPLPPEALYRACDSGALKFASSSELEDLPQLLGQERATAAVAFGIDIEHEGYNLYVMGPPGSGKHTLVQDFLAREGSARAHPETGST